MTSSSRHAFVSCEEFVKVAIEFEQHSAAFFRAMQPFAEGTVLQLLKMLERQEMAHEKLLKNFEIPQPNAMMQFVPDMRGVMPELPRGETSLHDLIELAIEKERRTKETYSAAAQFVTGTFRELVEGLAQFEAEHEEQLKSLRNI